MQQLALLLFVGLIAVLLLRDVKRRPTVSWASWLVVMWTVIIASRPVSEWMQSGSSGMTADAYLEGSPTDRAAFLLLIVAGAFVLVRRVSLTDVLRGNGWLFLFYGYCALSVLWSDYPFVAFKRWFKDFGNVIMVFLLLTERDPVDAIKAVMVRCACILVPLSVLFIRYMPDVGRFYSGYNTSDLMYVGVATHKNTLGALLLVSAIFLTWDLLNRARPSPGSKALRLDRVDAALLLTMALYLLAIANSATSLACTVLGTALFLVTGFKPVKSSLRYVELYIIAAAASWFVLDQLFGVTEFIVLSLGRDMGLTTRTDAWTFVLSQDINPLVGAGFKSFWTGERMLAIWVQFPGILQAHNGYVDKYLEGGALGLLTLAAMMFAGFRHVKKSLMRQEEFARVRLTFWIVVLFYNFSEAGFNAMSLLWFVTLLIVMEAPALAYQTATPPLVAPAPSPQPVRSPWRGRTPVATRQYR